MGAAGGLRARGVCVGPDPGIQKADVVQASRAWRTLTTPLNTGDTRGGGILANVRGEVTEPATRGCWQNVREAPFCVDQDGEKPPG